jgi:hypothetical protein
MISKVVKSMQSSNDQIIVDSCMQLSYSVITGQFFEEDNFGSFKSVDEAMEYLDSLASHVIDFAEQDEKKILIPQQFLSSIDPLALRSPTTMEAMRAINIDFPMSWRKEIKEIVWK